MYDGRFGVDPITTGAMIMSTYYAFFTGSRFLFGFVMERFGYFRILLYAGIAELALLIGYLSLGVSGLWLLPVIGIAVAPFYPAQQASMIKVFGRDATFMMGASSMISGVFTALTQYGIGFVNSIFGPARGFWFLTIFGLVSIYLHYIMGKKLNRQYGGSV